MATPRDTGERGWYTDEMRRTDRRELAWAKRRFASPRPLSDAECARFHSSIAPVDYPPGEYLRGDHEILLLLVRIGNVDRDREYAAWCRARGLWP